MWNFDPINPVKQLVSTTVAFAIFALLLSQLRRLAISRLELATSILFSLALVVPLVLADTPKITQLWGVFGRNNGLLSYLTLILMLSATYLIASKEFLKKFSDYLVATNLIMIAYCLLQIFQMDFIKFSKRLFRYELNHLLLTFISSKLAKLHTIHVRILLFAKRVCNLSCWISTRTCNIIS
jgi:carbon starvation protein CstA